MNAVARNGLGRSNAHSQCQPIARGKRSRVADAAFLAHNYAAARVKDYAYEDRDGKLVRVSLSGKSVPDILKMMSQQAKAIDRMQEHILEITGDEE